VLCEYCSHLLRYFIESFCNIYGKDQVVYNVHSLVHLCDDAKQFGALNNVPVFQFESFLGRLVKLFAILSNHACRLSVVF